MSGLKPALIALGVIGAVALVVALAVPFFTNRDAPVQVAVSNPAEAAAETDAPLTRPVHVRDARSAEPLAGIYQTDDDAGAARADWAHAYAGDVGSCTATLTLGSADGADWSAYAGRTLSLDADGLASLAVPAGAVTQSHLTVSLGGDWSVKSPLRDAWWQGGRARLFLSDASTRALIPAAPPHSERSATLTVKASPLDRCDRLDFRWESRAVIEMGVLATAAANAPVDTDRLLPACAQSGNVLEYVGPGGGSEPYDYECEEATGGAAGIAHITLDGYTVIADETDPSAGGQISSTASNAIEVRFLDVGDENEAKKFLAGNRLRITQTTETTPQWYEGTITDIARTGTSPDIDYTYTFDASDDLDSTVNADADAKRLPEGSGYEIIRIGSGLDYVRVEEPLTGNGKPGNPVGIDDATTTASGAMSAADKTRLDGFFPIWAANASYPVGSTVTHDNALYIARVASSDATFTPSRWYDLQAQVASGVGIANTVHGHTTTIAVEPDGITNALLADDAVETANIKDRNVTAAKLADGVLPTPRGAGTALELDGNDLDLILDVLRPAFPHQLVRTFVTTLDGTNNNFEVAVSNDNLSSVVRCGSAIGSSNDDDALLVEKDSATDGEILNGVEDGDWFFALRGDTRMAARIFCTDDDPTDSGVRRVWFNGDAAYTKGVDQYLQMGSGSGIISFSAMGNVGYLRTALPDGNTASISQTTQLLLGDFKTAELQHLAEHIVVKTAGPTNVTGTWEDGLAAITGKNGKIGWQTALVNGVGTLQWAIPDNVPVQGGGTVPRADVVAYFNAHHQIAVTVGGVVIKGPVQSFSSVGSLDPGTYFIVIGDNIGTPHRVAATQTGGNPSDGAAAAIQLQSNVPARDELADVAFTGDYDDLTNKPATSGASGSLYFIHGTPSASKAHVCWDDADQRLEFASSC